MSKPPPIRVHDRRLSGPNHLVDAPLTVDDWRQIHRAYLAFMFTVRSVAKEAWERQRAQGGEP